MGGRNIKDYLPVNVPKQYRGRCYVFFDEKLSKITEPYYLEPGLYSSIPDMKTLIQERNNRNDNCIRIKVNRVTQKSELYLTNEEYSLVVCSTDLGRLFGGDVRYDLGMIIRGKGLQKPTFTHDVFCIHSRMIYSDIWIIFMMEAQKHLCYVSFHSYWS